MTSKQINVTEAGVLSPVAGKSKWRVRIIAEGKGSSGTYTREVLERDGAKAFPVGTKVNVNHPTESERFDRPEGDVRAIAGAIISEPTWQDSPSPGLYADVQIGEKWAGFIEEFHKIIGLSIHAQAIVSPEVNESGSYDIMGLVPWPTNSVDIVTVPGAEGRFIEAFESAYDTMTDNYQIKEASVDLKDIQKVITEAIAPLIEAQKEPEAPTAPEVADTVRKIVEADIPSAVKIQIAEAVDANPGMNIDRMIENTTAIAEAVRTEVKEAAKAAAVEEGADLRKGGSRTTEELSLDGLTL